MLHLPAESVGPLIVAACALGVFSTGVDWLYLRRIKVGTAASPELTGILQEEDARELGRLQGYVAQGAAAFLAAEFRYMAVFVALMAVTIVVLIAPTAQGWDGALFSAAAFLWGALTSVLAGALGMRIAVYANARTAMGCARGYAAGFNAAFRGGAVMGFGLTALGLFNLYLGIRAFEPYFGRDRVKLFGTIAAYGLGGSSIALFGRVGGGIFTKAADVGADLVGKVQKNIPEDDPRNPGVIADCIGDNVGDIAGMGSDLFGSFAESTCAALVIASAEPALSEHWAAMLYPLLLTAGGIVASFLASTYATFWRPPTTRDQIEPALKDQLLISTCLATVSHFVLSVTCLPGRFDMRFMNGQAYEVRSWYCFVAVAGGLWAGLVIGYVTEHCTSHSYRPVREVAQACTTGASTNIIYGLALGYRSTLVPVLGLMVAIYIAYNMCGMFGLALCALGMLSVMCTALTIDGYGPISDNAGGLAEMAGLGAAVRERTDTLDAAGNTTAAIGKGYAIGSAALVSLALYGAFLTRVYGKHAVRVNLVDPRTFCGLLFGATVPYLFAAWTMKSVGVAAMAMVQEIERQFQTLDILNGRDKPDYERCVQIATEASLREMIAPGALVVLTPLVCGILFGREALAGLLPGAVVSGIQMAISASNTGGAWDNAKKYVEAGGLGAQRGKGSREHAAAVIGDTVGDPMKDTYGPAINIVMKLMAILSVVFAPVVASPAFSGLLFDHVLRGWASKDA